jgi:hypothetical protein
MNANDLSLVISARLGGLGLRVYSARLAPNAPSQLRICSAASRRNFLMRSRFPAIDEPKGYVNGQALHPCNLAAAITLVSCVSGCEMLRYWQL